MYEYVDNEVIRATFPEEYDLAYFKKIDTKLTELDDVTGLPIIEKETVYSKYGIYLKDNSFHNSCRDFFDKAGFLTMNQLKALRRD